MTILTIPVFFLILDTYNKYQLFEVWRILQAAEELGWEKV